MKLLKKISIGSINGVRGGLKLGEGFARVRVGTFAGITGSYKEKTSETMGTSFAFAGEFRAINQNGEEAAAPICFLPEPAQSLLKTQIDDLAENGGGNVEFGFHFWAVEDATAIKGYYFECEPLMEARPSNALAHLTKAIGMEMPTASAPALGHDNPAADTLDKGVDKAEVSAKGKKK
jgi:hypothetical protein